MDEIFIPASENLIDWAHFVMLLHLILKKIARNPRLFLLKYFLGCDPLPSENHSKIKLFARLTTTLLPEIHATDGSPLHLEIEFVLYDLNTIGYWC